MAKRSRGKKKGIIATLLLELSALAGIFGVTQATLRNNLWQVLKPQTVNSQLEQAPRDVENLQVVEVPRFTRIAQSPAAQSPAAQPRAYTQGFDQYASQPQPIVPRYVPEPHQPSYPSAYTAQAILPRNPRNPTGWNPSGYNPMGSYQ